MSICISRNVLKVASIVLSCREKVTQFETFDQTLVLPIYIYNIRLINIYFGVLSRKAALSLFIQKYTERLWIQTFPTLCWSNDSPWLRWHGTRIVNIRLTRNVKTVNIDVCYVWFPAVQSRVPVYLPSSEETAIDASAIDRVCDVSKMNFKVTLIFQSCGRMMKSSWGVNQLL